MSLNGVLATPATDPLVRHVAIIGTGHVGLTTGACLAHIGMRVSCCDVDAQRIGQLQSGVIPIFEDGLAELVALSLETGRLTFTVERESAVRTADVVFLCVPTPPDDDGSADLSHVIAAASAIGPMLKSGAVVVNKSTVPLGSFHVVGDALRRDDVHVVSNPDFLREGSAVRDFLEPDRIVIGAESAAAARRLAALYEPLDAEIIFTDPRSAELIKYAANGFLAMKVSFVNSVATLCEHLGADIRSVVEGISSDRRIGRSCVQPGPGWGGSCFPKVSRALVAAAAQHGYDFSLVRGVIDANEQQCQRMVHKVVAATARGAGQRLDGVTVGALGLTFKAGTDDLRESPSLRVIAALRELGASVQAYDPTTTGPLTRTQVPRLAGIELRPSALDAARGADVLVILTDWPEFGELDADKVAHLMSGTAVVDCRNMLDVAGFRRAGLTYQGVGRP